jgi:hypothetical protein
MREQPTNNIELVIPRENLLPLLPATVRVGTPTSMRNLRT